jgi:uncharacterized protein YhjY with autotransporter beta-barrel domain/phospholipase/lecithinase/hemolysin
MFRKNFRRAIVSASLATAAAVSTPAAAQQIDRIIVFGDSYADIGNALRLAGIDPLSTQVYTTGRFSGGSNYVDTLSNILQVQQYNFAIGGARTDNSNQSAGLPGLTFEVQEFLSGGGTFGFPAVDTTLDRSDLVAVSIGGNDARFYQQSGGSVAGAPAAAAVAVTSAETNLDLVMTQGTPTISFLAGDTGLLPEIAGDPAGAAVRTAYSTAFNSGMQQVLAGYANQGSIVHYLDLTKILENVSADPSAYGITNGLVCPTFPNPTCVVSANGYLFYGDALHLTSQGFAIVGQYVATQLAAPLTLQAPSDLGLDTARQWGRTLSSRSDLYARGGGADGLRIYALGDAFSRDLPQTDENSAFDIRGVGATIGAEYGVGGGLVGVAANYSRPRAKFGNESARDSGRSWQIGAYGSLSSGGLFGQAYLGYGKDKVRIRRTGVVEAMSATPHGSHFTAGAKGGYLVPIGGLKVGPVVALDYAHAKVNGYTESGDAALTLNVSSQKLSALTGQAGIQARGDLAGLHPFIDLTLEHDFSGDDRLISFSQTSAPVIVNRWAATRDKETYGRVAGGASADLGGNLSIDAYASTTIGRNKGQEMGGQLGVKVRF